MKRLAAAVLFAGLIGAAAAQDAEKELKKLEGEYKVKALAKGGMDAPAEVMDSIKGVAIKGDKLVIKVMGEDKTAKIKVDPTKKPAHIDISPVDGPEKDKTFLGVYKVEKGELTIVFTEGGERPKDFKGDGEKDMKLVLTRKEKDGK
jgi:uncharacterized protein (TIGR03067 family)